MKLELYHRWHCPYSAKVRNFITINKLDQQIKFHEIEEDMRAEIRLENLTGKTRVPCLVIDNKPLLESQAIMDWLRDNLLGGNGVSAH